MSVTPFMTLHSQVDTYHLEFTIFNLNFKTSGPLNYVVYAIINQLQTFKRKRTE